MVDFPEFQAPIPGESLTKELGSRPWQRPPQFATVEEAASFYIEKLTDPKVSSGIVVALDNEIPISVLVNSIMLGAVMEGKHTIDVGVIITPLLIELCEFLGKEAGVDYITGLEDEEDDTILESVVGIKAMKKFKKMNKDSEEAQEEKSLKEGTALPEIKPKGLMARPDDAPVQEEGVM